MQRIKLDKNLEWSNRFRIHNRLLSAFIGSTFPPINKEVYVVSIGVIDKESCKAALNASQERLDELQELEFDIVNELDNRASTQTMRSESAIPKLFLPIFLTSIALVPYFNNRHDDAFNQMNSSTTCSPFLNQASKQCVGFSADCEALCKDLKRQFDYGLGNICVLAATGATLLMKILCGSKSSNEKSSPSFADNLIKLKVPYHENDSVNKVLKTITKEMNKERFNSKILAERFSLFYRDEKKQKRKMPKPVPEEKEQAILPNQL